MPKPTTQAPVDRSTAERVRERFTAGLGGRVELVTKSVIAKADALVEDYFNKALETPPYNPYRFEHEVQRPNAQRGTTITKMVAEIEIFNAATEFASGNSPQLKQAYDAVAQNPKEWAAVIDRVKKHHENLGFTVFFGTDETDAATIVLRLHDPSFESAVNETLKGG